MGKVGRPKDELRHRFERILEQSNADEKFRSILAAAKKPETFLKAYEMAYDRAYGKAQQFVDMDLNDVTKRQRRLDTLEAIARRAGLSVNGDSVDKGE